MKKIVLKADRHGAKLLIDGVEVENIYSLKIEKTPDGPITIHLSGAVTNEVQIDI